jgi:hypothetical protein
MTRQGRALIAYGMAILVLNQGVSTSECEKLTRSIETKMYMLLALVGGCRAYQMHRAGTAII